MSIVVTSPILSYVSSQDAQSTPNGTTNYMILFDASNASTSNIIMFEYKFQTINEAIPNLENTTFGFVSVENAIQSGIVNQYIISVPVAKNTLTGAPEESIQVRVYYGDLASSDIVVSEWSNELSVYLPPQTPVIFTTTGFQGSYYDPSSSELFVLLKEADNSFNFTDINFIVCFFYQNDSGLTLWKVSDPTPALPTTLGTESFRYIEVPLEGTVSTDPLYNKVYVSIHSVYDWQTGYYMGNSYHSISYISNEVESILASEDQSPDITSVDYNVYTTPLPGDQTMTVNWIAPGNSAIPFFNVDHYELYFSLDGGASFTLVPDADNISSTTFSYTVDVGTTGLNLACGDNVVFRVNAIDVQGTNTPSDPSSPTDIFKYSEAVTNLTITNTTWDGTSLVGLTVNFDGVTDLNKGCGAGLQYVVEIDGSVYAGTGSLVYSSGSSYSIEYTGLSIPQTGDVVVYLQTQNTNPSPVSPLNGESATVPYVANNVILDPVDYEVYTYEFNPEQNMNLSWSDPSAGSWTAINYTVQFTLNGGANWNFAENTGMITSYAFDASPYAVLVPTNIEFRVLATMVNGPNQYVITSNTESKYTFKYAENVQNEILNWVIADTSNQFMDVSMRFNNPLTNGVNNGLEYFTVKVMDELDNTIASQDINYVDSNLPYFVNFNNITYSFNGLITVEAFVNDTNSNSLLTSTDYKVSLGYQASTVPIFVNINVSNEFITGNILTHDQLKPVGKVFPFLNQSLEAQPLIYSTTLDNTPGFTISFITEIDDTLNYTFSIDRAVFFAGVTPEPTGCIIAASNNAGIGNIQVPFNGL